MKFATRVAVTTLLCALQPAQAEDKRPDWITDEKLARLKDAGIEPATDVEAKGNYHWRYRARNKLVAGGYSCPIGSSVDISRNIVLILAPEGAPCTSVNKGAFDALKLLPNGSAEPL